MAKIKVKPSGYKPGVKSIFVDVEHISTGDIVLIRKKLKNLIKSEDQVSDAFAKAFEFALSKAPKANPSDIWQHIIYRSVLDLGFSDQQWKRISGFAFERAFASIYNPRVGKYGLRIRPLPRNDAHTILGKLGFKGEIKKDKIDCVVEQQNHSGWAVISGLHVKASLAERIQDDVPASLALMQKKLLSIVITLDSKSFPPPHGDGVNYGELGGRTWSRDQTKYRIKRQYIEEDGQFDALFSYNLRTPPSEMKTLSGKRIEALGFHDQQPDKFIQFLVGHLEHTGKIKL